MPLRDIFVTLVVVGGLPACFVHPWVGVLLWSWIAYMNPHRLTWGFAHDAPFAQMIAIATLLGFLFTRDRSPLPRTRETYLLMALWTLFTLSTVFALYPDLAWEQWQKVSKVFLFTFLTLMLFQDRTRLRYLFLTIALSLGFYALKGGIFAILTGGQHRVQYPDSLMGGNTGFGLAINMALPMFFFLARSEHNRWLRRLLHAMLVSAIPGVAFTYSRGALLGLGAVILLLLVKANRKVIAALGVTVMAVFLVNFAPAYWFARMESIGEYEQDASAQMRFESWWVFYQIGLDRPLLGAGFRGPIEDDLYKQYVPNPLRGEGQNAHNMFLNVWGEHGIIAFGVYIALLLCCLLTLRRLRRRRGNATPPAWVRNYSHMIEVSLVGYMACGMFLSAAYMELYYTLVAIVIILQVLAERPNGGEQEPSEVTAVAVPKTRVAHVRHRRAG